MKRKQVHQLFMWANLLDTSLLAALQLLNQLVLRGEQGPVHTVRLLRVEVFILFKVEKFLSDIGFVMIFSRLRVCQQKTCLVGG